MLSKHQIVNWLLDCEHIFTEQRDYLTALDTDIGDGDHGLNMQRGFTKVAEKLPAVADKDIGQVLKTTGMTLLSSVGGASGPLYGTFFIRAAASSDACQSLTLSQLGKMLADGVEGIVSRGRAEPGDKTMCDAWWPALAALQQAEQQGLPLPEALDKAVAAAAAGAEATIQMQARKGRASYLGERSIGHQDAGATSTLLLLTALRDRARL
ncbi:dihydroxyacetone kinase subunit DhaL [Aeromonas taiwanensis]|jgi:dihydroxyacetone kinase-like protein|uniref:dihydroxyacetone kinase subunit DhaL n=1 Tax=Aeromonas taiwanensis TaxID=633417 RepID=UPI00207C981D|nr:dihydroxyacetone kinase subunit DhaL [Aeromonas taiwanensis]MCO4204975.1 dihydroxyacetone kinase subunit DhaL [Aeromonas taiwanensis]